MSGSGKQSFYEIQLNNSSLIVAFVIAVGIGVAVFMLGVRVGRSQVPQAIPAGGWVEDLAPEGATTDPIPAPEQQEDASPEQSPSVDSQAPSEEPTPAAETVADPPTATPATTDPAPRANPGLPPADDSLADGFVVQVKATPNLEEARDLQATLARDGFPANVVEADTDGTTLYRVRVGRYRSRDDAELVAAALDARDDISDTWVTRG